MSVYYNIQITTGEPTTTYNIYYNLIGSSNIATLYYSSLPATNLPYSALTSGILISIPDNSTSIIIVDQGECKSTQIFNISPTLPAEPPTEICLSFIRDGISYNWNFIYCVSYTVTNNTSSFDGYSYYDCNGSIVSGILSSGSSFSFCAVSGTVTTTLSLSDSGYCVNEGTFNGKTKWMYNDGGIIYFIKWNMTAQQWEMEYDPNTKFILTTNSTNPIGTWNLSSSLTIPYSNIQSSQGPCLLLDSLEAKITPTNTYCFNQTPCNGSIVILATGGVPPYTYSIDGINYQTSNIIQNLCQGTFIVLTKDSSGAITTNQTNIGYTTTPTVYIGNVVLQSNTIIQDVPQVSRTEQSTWELKFDNTIPIGTYINFTLKVKNEENVYSPGSGQTTSTTQVYLNNSLQSPSTSTTGTSQIVIGYCGPQPRYNNYEIIEDEYIITMTNGDRVTGTTTSSLQITSGQVQNSCMTFVLSTITVSASSLPNNTITGCGCCNVIFEKNTPPVINTNIRY